MSRQVETRVLSRAVPTVDLVGWSGYPLIVLLASLVVQTMASFGTQGIAPLAPYLVEDLGISRAQVGLLVTATYGGAVLVLILAGGLCDRFGVRAPFVLGLALSGVPLAFAALAPSYFWLLLPLALCGLGNGCALPPTTRAIVDWIPTDRRGLAMGIKQTGVPLAGILCGLIVPAIGEVHGWRGAFLVLGMIAVTASLAVGLVYRDRPARPEATGPLRRSFGAVMKDRNLVLLGGVTWLNAGVQLSFIGFLVLFLLEHVGVSLGVATALLVVAQASGVVGQVLWGAASDALFGGRRKVVMGIIGVLAAAGSLALAQTDADTPVPLLGLLIGVVGISARGWSGINMIFVAELAGRREAATAAGMNLTANYLGVMLFPPLFGLLVDVTSSYASAFGAAGLASLLALLLLQFVRPRPAEEREP
jgi:MFS family permease